MRLTTGPPSGSAGIGSGCRGSRATTDLLASVARPHKSPHVPVTVSDSIIGQKNERALAIAKSSCVRAIVCPGPHAQRVRHIRVMKLLQQLKLPPLQVGYAHTLGNCLRRHIIMICRNNNIQGPLSSISLNRIARCCSFNVTASLAPPTPPPLDRNEPAPWLLPTIQISASATTCRVLARQVLH